MIKSTLIIFIPLFLFSANYSFSQQEYKSIQMAKKWINGNSRIKKQKDGFLGFYYDDSMPSVICKPLNATMIKLGKGEVYKTLRTGDIKRWKFDVVEKATEDRTFILVKPEKSEIMTNLIIFTNQRTYNIKLISSSSNWTPSISFIYKNGSQTNISDSIQPPEYMIESDGIWKPFKIFTKNAKTYINIGESDIKNIRLYLINKNMKKTVTYTYKNKNLVIDAIIDEAILIRDYFTKTIIKISKI